jgi:hypothetical protein
MRAGVFGERMANKNKFPWRLLGGRVFLSFGGYWVVMGEPPFFPSHGRSFGINTLAGLHRQVFEG